MRVIPELKLHEGTGRNCVWGSAPLTVISFLHPVRPAGQGLTVNRCSKCIYGILGFVARALLFFFFIQVCVSNPPGCALDLLCVYLS